MGEPAVPIRFPPLFVIEAPVYQICVNEQVLRANCDMEHPTSDEVRLLSKTPILLQLKPLHNFLHAEAATESYCECLMLADRVTSVDC